MKLSCQSTTSRINLIRTVSLDNQDSMASSFHEYLPALALPVILLAGAGLLKGWKAASRLPFPPGPKPRFIMGNLYDIPSELPWTTYTKWGKEYGDLVHLQVFGDHILIVNSLEAAVELLEKRGQIYSDRPTIPMVNLMGWDFTLTGMLYTEKFRQSRRMFYQHFRKEAIVAHRPIQLRKIRDLLRSLSSTPDDFIAHIKTLAVAIIMATTYGYDIKPTNDRFVYLAEKAVQRLGESVLPGAFAVNALPFLRYLPSWFPGCGFHRFARETSELVKEMKNAPFDFQNGVGRLSVLGELLEYNDGHGGSEEREEMIKDVVATAYGAAADTTSTTLVVFIMAMALHPEVVQKAQNEIDSVIGLDRLPGFDDRSALPYCEAVYREVLRWRPVVPLAIAHAASEDDVYEGYFIPKGTMVLPNVWAMVHDESTYPNPDQFNPERFLNADGQALFNEVTSQAGIPRLSAHSQQFDALAGININMILASRGRSPSRLRRRVLHNAEPNRCLFLPVLLNSNSHAARYPALRNANEGTLFNNQSAEYDVAQYASNLFPLLGDKESRAVVSLYQTLGYQVDAIMGECSSFLCVLVIYENLIRATCTFVCPAYLLLDALSGSGKAYKGEYAIPPALHGDDAINYFHTFGGTLRFNNTDFINAFTQGFLTFAVNLDPNNKLRPSIASLWRKWSRGAETELVFNEMEQSTPHIMPANTSSMLLRRCEYVISFAKFPRSVAHGLFVRVLEGYALSC
ncbi:Cytochrome p450 [Mycena venus]|uniref:Cytochrome p450 n=1 Tax=Mycena venus TaxID=2733690 RepID=A0A8H6YVJ3_9AGAR|nr:Cytochrome p450 [Mycena venus]